MVPSRKHGIVLMIHFLVLVCQQRGNSKPAEEVAFDRVSGKREEKFCEYGCCGSTVTSIEQRLNRSLKKSTCRLSQQDGISRRSSPVVLQSLMMKP
ncbi:hypothetical protein Bpfe_030028 [Biomphalaria pfeifferi]|uniref:Secreted protein n=1 Tax=Biomphalaria pfeifferi TaxID=112525 RepID=A0AAD8ARJ5_BIOPF|nr:hypothetical protein Bpfe_030028 [Biomphalaria pfeifferi]